MIVDAARDPQIFGLLLGSYLEYCCLYSGTLPKSLEAAAPYLVHLEFEDRRTRHLLKQSWGNSWGIFLSCDTRLQTLRRHLRGLLTVRGPSGDRLLFRYYDPRVLRVYLPTCTSEELATMFGPIERIWAGGEAAETMVELGFDGARLVRDEFDVHTPRARQAMPIGTRNVTAPERRGAGMLMIRREQFSAFSKSEVRKFEDWMVVHLTKFFPRQCRALGEAKLRAEIQLGIQRAAGHGLKVKRDVCKYIDVMFALGRDFDTDVRFPWALQMLNQQTTPDIRAQGLFNAAVRHLRGS